MAILHMSSVAEACLQLKAPRRDPRRLHSLQIYFVLEGTDTPIADLSFMEWQVRYQKRSIECVGRYPTREIALKAACLLIDQGCDVLGIGLTPGIPDLDREKIAEFYLSWAHERWMVTTTEPSRY